MAPVAPRNASASAPAAAVGEKILTDAVAEKRRLLILVRTGLTLAIGYLLVFSAGSPAAAPPSVLAFVIAYIASNIVIALMPAGFIGRAAFDLGVVLFDTAAISGALLLMPDSGTDVLVFYFTVILLASISDRLILSLLAPVLAGGAYLMFLLARHPVDEVMQPNVLLRLPFFLLTGAFYGFFVERVRRAQAAVSMAGQRVRARTDLLAMITHDLKQPLWIAGQSAALLYEQLDPADRGSRALAAEVLLNLKRMESLTLNFLDLSKIEARGLSSTPRRVSLNRIVEDLVATYRPAADLRGLQVSLEMDPALPEAWVDPMQTERCLANLLDNAIKFTPAGGTITLGTVGEGEWNIVIIGDSGPGIGPAQREAIFAPFQAGSGTGGRHSTGLGLHIARALVISLGGGITLDTAQPRGAWFRIQLPAAKGITP